MLFLLRDQRVADACLRIAVILVIREEPFAILFKRVASVRVPPAQTFERSAWMYLPQLSSQYFRGDPRITAKTHSPHNQMGPVGNLNKHADRCICGFGSP